MKVRRNISFAESVSVVLLPPLEDGPLPTTRPGIAAARQAHDKCSVSVQQRRAWLVDEPSRAAAASVLEWEARLVDTRMARCLFRTIQEGSRPDIAARLDQLVGVPGTAASRVEDARALYTEMVWNQLGKPTSLAPVAPPALPPFAPPVAMPVAPPAVTPQTSMPRMLMLPSTSTIFSPSWMIGASPVVLSRVSVLPMICPSVMIEMPPGAVPRVAVLPRRKRARENTNMNTTRHGCNMNRANRNTGRLIVR